VPVLIPQAVFVDSDTKCVLAESSKNSLDCMDFVRFCLGEICLIFV
jgi:hypothetical protein